MTDARPARRWDDEHARLGVEDHDAEPVGRERHARDDGVDPAVMGIGPIPAVRKLLGRTGVGVADLDEATRKQLERGRRVTELLKQPQYQPLQVWELAVALFAANNGYLDDLEVAQVLPFEKGLREYLKSSHADLVKRIEDTKELSKDDEALLHTALKDFKKSGAY